MTTHPTSEGDVWSEWLLHTRHADNGQYEQAVRRSIERHADRVLDHAQLAPGMVLADIGTGDGLVAFRAFERTGGNLQVVMTDISQPALAHAEQRAAERGVRERCVFLRCGADGLIDIGSGTIDVVTTRAVLAYVGDKAAALREFMRILKPGGRISLGEPVMQDDAFLTRALRNLIDVSGPGKTPAHLPLLHRWKAAQYPDTDEKIRSTPITSYSERDLIRLAQAAGFDGLHLELHIDVLPSIIPGWQSFLDSSPHPLAPPVSRILAEQFSPAEREAFEKVMRPVVENPKTRVTERFAFLTAHKPVD